MPLRPEVAWFARQMERVLQKHDDTKGGYVEADMSFLFSRLVEEAEELQQALDKKENVIDEAIDVANFAMMIAFNHYLKGGKC